MGQVYQSGSRHTRRRLQPDVVLIVGAWLAIIAPMSMQKPPAPGYHILTWGCQMNDEDSEQLGLFLEEMGYRPVSRVDDASVILLNTCSVRRKPEDKVYSKLGELKSLKLARPETILGVCGCMAQVESAEIRRRAPHVDFVMGTGNLGALPEVIRRVLRTREIAGPDSDQGRAAVEELHLPERRGAVVTDVPLRNLARRPKLKAHVPIMYGCDKFCSFCIVPFTRGRERSRPTAEILREVEWLARGGTREVTLLGQTVNSYGKNLAEGRVPFATLLERIDAIPGIRRIRFTSPYPRDFSDDLIQAIGRLPKVCEHVHLPLQAGDDELLGRMRRGYTVSDFLRIVDKLREQVPGIAITTDILVGFPGETEAQFRNTLRVVERVRFDGAFMFAYSVRPGTRAAEMPDQVPREVKVARLNEVIALQNSITLQINQAHVGSEVEVLVEGRSERDRTRLAGYTRTFKMVHLPAPAGKDAERLVGRLVKVRVLSGALTGYHGELVTQDTPREGVRASVHGVGERVAS